MTARLLVGQASPRLTPSSSTSRIRDRRRRRDDAVPSRPLAGGRRRGAAGCGPGQQCRHRRRGARRDPPDRRAQKTARGERDRPRRGDAGGAAAAQAGPRARRQYRLDLRPDGHPGHRRVRRIEVCRRGPHRRAAGRGPTVGHRRRPDRAGSGGDTDLGEEPSGRPRPPAGVDTGCGAALRRRALRRRARRVALGRQASRRRGGPGALTRRSCRSRRRAPSAHPRRRHLARRGRPRRCAHALTRAATARPATSCDGRRGSRRRSSRCSPTGCATASSRAPSPPSAAALEALDRASRDERPVACARPGAVRAATDACAARAGRSDGGAPRPGRRRSAACASAPTRRRAGTPG